MTRENTKTYIVILNWNGTSDTIACLQSLKLLEKVNYQLILVDNNSEESNYSELKQWCLSSFDSVAEYSQVEAVAGGISETEKMLQSSCPDESLLIIRNEDNHGFAAGNNVALNYILSKEESDNYTLLLNNDTVVEPDFLKELQSFMSDNPNYVACTPQIRLFEPSNKIWNCGGNLLWFGNRRYNYAGENITNVPQSGTTDVTYVTGCALFFKPQRTGILTDKFFFGEEDMDFSWRQKKAGNKMACVFSSVIYHKVHASVGRLTGSVSLGKVYLFYLMRFIDNRQYVNKSMFRLQIILNIMYAVPMIKFRYKARFIDIFRLFRSLLKELRTTDAVSKHRSLELLNSKVIL